MPRIKIKNANLFFDVYGSKLNILPNEVKQKPTLLVLHGGHGFADHVLYVEFWSQFADIAQVIFLDQRGCGRSDWRDESEWNLIQWGDDISQFCQALEIEKPIIAGVSIGGHVICDYVTRYPDHPGALIFCNTEARFDLDLVCNGFKRLGGNEIAELVRQNFSNPTSKIIEQYKLKCVPYYAKNAYTSEEMARCQQHLDVFEFYCKYEIKHFNYLDKLHTIKCPCLFMVGADSPLHPIEAAKEMAKKIDNHLVKFKVFENAGAPVYKDSPEESYQIVADFINANT